jgi:hypothetical protein
MTDSNVEERGRKERSPSFPFIPLRKAIDRAVAMFAAHRRSPARISVVGETWAFSPSSSGLVQTVAALRAYGLLDDVGRGEDRRLQISDLATRILSDSRPGARESAIHEAATKPKILAEYLQEWLPTRPSDAHCISELTLDRGFTPDAAASFIRVFDDNISFAGLKKHDKEWHVDLKPENFLVDRPSVGIDRIDPKNVAVITGIELQPSVFPTATLPLPEGLVTMSVPSGLSERSIALLKNWIGVIVELSAWQAPTISSPPPTGPEM